MSARPKILYKYLSYNKGSELVLSDCTIKFTRPKDFNDPFDCKAVDISHWKSEDWIEFFSKEGYPVVEATKLATQAIDEKVTNENFVDFVNDFGVFCLSEVNDDILMWSHYADHHKGFCVGFHIDNNNYFSEVYNVNYEKIYPKLSASACKKEKARTIMLSKSCDWEYEREWRKIKCLKLPNGKRLSEIQPYPENLLASVIFGAKITECSRQKLLDILDKKTVQPDIFNAKLCGNKFSLEIVNHIKNNK